MTAIDAALRSAIPETAGLYEALSGALRDAGVAEEPVEIVRLKKHVYRVRAGSNGVACSVVLKSYDPWLARRNELVARRWLPALDLQDACAQLFATAGDRTGRTVWHLYEDLGVGAVDAEHPDGRCVGLVVDLIAGLHIRAAGHPLLPECRHYCGSLGAAFFAANLRDAIAVLEPVDLASQAPQSLGVLHVDPEVAAAAREVGDVEGGEHDRRHQTGSTGVMASNQRSISASDSHPHAPPS